MSSLASLSFYHGTIDTRECREILPEVGNFLLRNISKDEKELASPACVLTVAISQEKNDYSLKDQVAQRLKSYAVNEADGSFSLQNTTETFPSVQGLCESLIESKKPLPGGGVLQKAIPRFPWQMMLSEMEFPSPEIILGKGTYGKVIKARMVRKTGNPVDVAVKETREGNDPTLYSEVYTEARAMRRLLHPNIIRLEGVVVEKLPILLVIELFDGTCLLNALEKKSVPDLMRVPVICSIMYGLGHMHANNYIHRDIAARNVMISTDCRNVKIIDFGLAKHGSTFNLEIPQKIPVKWLAPEVIKTWTFSAKSDVWALAITSWEVFHDGAEPYSNIQKGIVKSSINKRKGKDTTEALRITENLKYLTPPFEELFAKMLTVNSRTRPDMTAIISEMEAKVIGSLDPKVSVEIRRMNPQNRKSKMGPQPPSSNASTLETDRNSKSPIPPKKNATLKTVTRRAARGKKSSASASADKDDKPPEKPPVKSSTVRRKNKT